MGLSVLDLCAGAAGGWSLGAHRAGLRTVAACEAVAWRRAMYAVNFPGVVLYDDLRTLTADRVRRDCGAFPGLVLGSPPCGEYSEINQRGGGIDADDLFLHGIRVVDEGRPDWVAFENSPRLKSRGYDRIAPALEAIGYTPWPLVVGVGTAGAAHERDRTFIVATDLSRPQRRLTGQPRPNVGMAPHLSEVVWWTGAGREDGSQADHGDQGIAGYLEQRLGPAGTERLGRHLREYDGLPSRLAEQCREAYGDAVCPQLTEAVVRSILQVEAALSSLSEAA